MLPSWKLGQPAGNVLIVRMVHTGSGWRQWFLKLADIHFDSVFCNRKLLKALLEEARERNAPVNVYGDLFDVMQGKSDRRSDTGEMRKEYVGVPGVKYLDAVLEDAVEFWRPYADLLMDVSEGNHDNKAADNAESNLLARFSDALSVQYMRYSGWIRYQMKMPSGGHKVSKTEYYTHGSGGDAPVTLGMIGTNRRQVSYVADIYVNGHNHNQFMANVPYAYVSPSGREVIADTLHINIPSLKDEWSQHSGFHTETGKPPKPIGGCWMFFEHNARVRGEIHVDALRAK